MLLLTAVAMVVGLAGCRPASREIVVPVPVLPTQAAGPVPSAADRAAAPRITADTLYTIYSQNIDLGAGNPNQKFLNRLLLVTGVFDGVNRSLPGRTYLALRTPDYDAFVYATLAPDAAPLLSTLQTGETVRLLCWGDGMTIGSPLLRDCRMG